MSRFFYVYDFYLRNKIFKIIRMNTKLTLSIDEEVVQKAKDYARSNGRSLSDLIENYLRGITSESEESQVSTPLSQQLLGAFRTEEEVSVLKNLTIKYRENE